MWGGGDFLQRWNDASVYRRVDRYNCVFVYGTIDEPKGGSRCTPVINSSGSAALAPTSPHPLVVVYWRK